MAKEAPTVDLRSSSSLQGKPMRASLCACFACHFTPDFSRFTRFPVPHSEGMYMTSSASNGSASISIYFKQGTNADMAAVNVQNRVVQDFRATLIPALGIIVSLIGTFAIMAVAGFSVR